MLSGISIDNNNLPLFVTIKDSDILSKQTNNAQSLAGGEVVSLKPTLEEARACIPMPVCPNDPHKQKLLEDHDDFYEIELVANASSAGMSSAGNEDTFVRGFAFHDAPWSEEALNDYKIFGVSYSIIWLCPNDSDTVVKYLLDHVQKKAGPHGQIGSSILWRVWNDFIERIFGYSDDPLEDFWDLSFEVRNDFLKQVSSLPLGPTKTDLDDFDGLLIK